MKQEQELLTLDATVENVVYKNEESGFCVLDVSAGDDLITAVGEIAVVEPGEEVTLTGYFTSHPNFGEQFKVQVFDRKLPTTARAIRKFLSSGAVKGIGPALAGRIVEMFGEQTLERIEKDPGCLTQVKGISQSIAENLAHEFEKLFGVRRVMLYLEKFGIKATDSVKVWSKWGTFAIGMIEENPYSLCCEEIGLAFSAADEIAEKLELPQNDAHRVQSGLEYVLRYNARVNGHTCLPREKLVAVASGLLRLDSYEIDDLLEEQLQTGRFYSYENGKEFIFLTTYYLAEQYCAERIALMLENQQDEPPGLDAVIDLEEESCGLEYAPLQRKAIRDAVSSSLFILTGGPGTGKTTILNAVISILEQRGDKVGICAPTGRAAKRLSEVSGQDAKTIHRMLGVQMQQGERSEFVHNEQNPLKYDAVIVDEMSMVDSLLFASLLKAAKPSCKFILTGDCNQLPSVSAGNVLKDLISSGCIPFIELREIFRQSAQSLIVTNAHAIVNDEYPELERTDSDFFFLGRRSLEAAAYTIAELVEVRLPASYGFSPIDDIQVICPSRKTVIGTVELNRLLQSKLNPPEPGRSEFKFGLYTYREGDKVMQVRNNYDIQWKRDGESGQGIFNGDIGYITKINRAAGVMQVLFDGRTATYTTEMAKELELAYAITIHKSQGNEFRAVVMPVMGGETEFYNRNLFYTGITRAKELLILVGSSRSVGHMVKQIKVNYRYTGLKSFLTKAVLGE